MRKKPPLLIGVRIKMAVPNSEVFTEYGVHKTEENLRTQLPKRCEKNKNKLISIVQRPTHIITANLRQIKLSLWQIKLNLLLITPDG